MNPWSQHITIIRCDRRARREAIELARRNEAELEAIIADHRRENWVIFRSVLGVVFAVVLVLLVAKHFVVGR